MIIRSEIVKSDERYKSWFIGFIVCILFCIFGLIFSMLSPLDSQTVGVTLIMSVFVEVGVHDYF